MRVHWTETAENHLAAIHNYIAQNSPDMPSKWLIG